jgi:hypothetical protein
LYSFVSHTWTRFRVQYFDQFCFEVIQSFVNWVFLSCKVFLRMCVDEVLWLIFDLVLVDVKVATFWYLRVQVFWNIQERSFLICFLRCHRSLLFHNRRQSNFFFDSHISLRRVHQRIFAFLYDIRASYWFELSRSWRDLNDIIVLSISICICIINQNYIAFFLFLNAIFNLEIFYNFWRLIFRKRIIKWRNLMGAFEELKVSIHIIVSRTHVLRIYFSSICFRFYCSLLNFLALLTDRRHINWVITRLFRSSFLGINNLFLNWYLLNIFHLQLENLVRHQILLRVDLCLTFEIGKRPQILELLLMLEGARQEQLAQVEAYVVFNW